MMTREKYETLSLTVLKDLAKARGLKGVSTLRKGPLIERMLEEDAKAEAKKTAEEAAAEAEAKKPAEEPAPAKSESRSEAQAESEPAAKRRGRPRKNPAPAEVSKEEKPAGQARRGRPRKTAVRTAEAAEVAEAESPAPVRKSAPAEKPAAGERAVPDGRVSDEKAASDSRALEERPAAGESAVSSREGMPGASHREGAEPHSRNENRARGILEVMPDGFGFLRSQNFLPGENDVYVSPSQIRRFSLKTGDMVTGFIRTKTPTEKFGALLYVETVNDLPPDEARRRPAFESMTPTFPCQRIRLERPDGSIATRIVDLISPIGKGQRGMIVSPPKAGKTTLLKDIARSILRRDPEANLMILLIDERPEEVTDMKESVSGKNVEIIYSTFDEMPEHHKRVSEMVIERAKRLVEHKKDVIILLDSITRLARAYNVLVPPSGRTLSGGLDPTALYMPKRFFGAARNMREGGSLTILATALVDTGSKMDDVVYEEFKGTGNMELILDRKLQERRIFPAIDIVKSGTRREDLLLTQTELEAVNRMRRSMNGMKSDEAVEAILHAFAMTNSNDKIVNAVLSGRLT